MAHRLVAGDGGRCLSPPLVVARLKCAFAYVEADEEEGHRHVGGIIRQLQQMARNDSIPADDEYLQRLTKVQRNSLYVYFGDDPGSELACLDTAVIPAEPLYFDYHSAAHESRTRHLLLRCAQVLGYEVVEVRIEAWSTPSVSRPNRRSRAPAAPTSFAGTRALAVSR